MVLHFGSFSDSGISLILAGILTILGGIPLLNQMGIIGFGLGPLESFGVQIFLYVAALGGMWLLFDALWGKEHGFLKYACVIVGLVVIVIGVIPILNQFGYITYTITFITPMIYNIMFITEAVLLIFSAAHQ